MEAATVGALIGVITGILLAFNDEGKTRIFIAAISLVVLALALGGVDWKEFLGGPVGVGGDVATGLKAVSEILGEQGGQGLAAWLLFGLPVWFITSETRNWKSKNDDDKHP